MDVRKRPLWPRCLSLLLALAMLAGLLPAALAADNVGEPDLSLTSSSETIKVGGTLTLEATVTAPEGAIYDKNNISWESSNPAVASVSDDGTVKGLAVGDTQISAEIEIQTDASTRITKTATCDIKVEGIPVEGISLSKTSLTLVEGKNERLSVNFSPENATNKTVHWSATGGVTVVDGLVTAVTAGEAVVTATSEDGNFEAQCNVTVTAAPVTTTVTVSPTSISLPAGGSTKLTASASDGSSVTWSSNKTSVATVSSSGNVTAVGAGTATITATTKSGASASCTVTVSSTISVSSVSLPSSTTVSMGKTVQLSPTISPSTATNKNVTWKSSNESVAKVSSSGVVTGVAVGSANITVTTSDGGKTATCRVVVTSPAAADVTYSTAKGEPVTFDASDFNSVCNKLMGRNLNYVKFSLPSSSNGTLYYNYSDGDYDRELTSSDECRRNGSPSLSSVTFVPKSSRTGKVTISYTGWDSSGYEFTGEVVISIDTNDGVISYSTAKNTPVTLDDSSFNDFSQDVNDSNFDYIQFTLPSSSYGTLYYGYDSDGDYERAVSSNTKYYRSSSYYLDEVTFVPRDNYTGTVNISFTGRSTDGDSLSGTLRIYVGVSSSDDISYSTDINESVPLVEQDFIDFCKAETGVTFDYVTFTPPSSSRGYLYYNYRSSSSSNTKVSSGTRYYRNSSPYLENITFVPAKDYEGTVSIPFSGYSADDEKFSGTLRIYVGAGAGDVTYSASIGEAVTFSASDFNSFCKDLTDANLNYVRFTLPSSSSGTLYYDYNTSTGKYDSRVTSNTSYYRSSSPKLNDVTFVPASNVTGTVAISFTGRSTNSKSFSGTVVITYDSLKEPSVIRYSTTGLPVQFNISDFNSASKSRGGAELNYLTFTTPSSTYGKLYLNYASPISNGGVLSSNTYCYASGNPSIGSIAFVPKAGFNGIAYLYYSAKDKNGSTYSGTVEISVTPASSSSVFTDVGVNYNWAASAVDFLNKTGVVKGTGSNQFSPAMTMTRCDYILMLYRAYNLQSYGTSSFPDVPADSYYAEAVAAAKALGIVTADANGKFNPLSPVTRQDSMLFLQRAMKAAGQVMADGPASALAAFSDRGSVDSAAQGAVAAMVQAGIIKGDGSGHLNPTSALSRAEMVTILHRALTL